ncbi:hypothetical protein GUJ93_ZPchr0006g41927 [Zizania palustris]|uniref:Uncharacterized protein n=1 Tax=Zizania palustris TaxID=103762 RepID=A0A8J5SHL5_ZIZPA|nr:hypothetical protein GUJ93_ZPchr0006g41927 [Zizania palustris]
MLSPLPSDNDYYGRGNAMDPDAVDVDDVVSLKVSLLEDCQIGKTSFVVTSRNPSDVSPCFFTLSLTLIIFEKIASC